ncbi:MAG: hypothetical protein U0L20_08800 [Ruminococcus sp.]|nr:hypothetical protein [Ruminococcus sp.]
MGKLTTPNRKAGRMIAKNLIVLFTVLVAAFSGMWAWFSNKTEIKTSGLLVKCEAPDGVEIAVVEHNAPPPEPSEYKTSIILDESGFLAKLILTEVTSDGITFFRPTLTQQNGIASPTPEDEWTQAAFGQSYLCFDLYMRSKTRKNIYFEKTCSVDPISKVLTWQSGDGSGYNPSTYGDFSKDAIVGATRVSVLSGDGNNTRNLLWIPRPDVLLNQNGSEYSVSTGLSKEQSPKSYVHNYWNESKTPATIKDVVTSVIENGKTTLGKRVKIADFTTSDTKLTEGYYYTHIVFNAWVEGEDDEARLALSGGQFAVNLNLATDYTNTK